MREIQVVQIVVSVGVEVTTPQFVFIRRTRATLIRTNTLVVTIATSEVKRTRGARKHAHIKAVNMATIMGASTTVTVVVKPQTVEDILKIDNLIHLLCHQLRRRRRILLLLHNARVVE